MKYKDFKIFKFSTILKNIYIIKDSFSRIFKKIKNIPSNIADSLSYTLKDIFSTINKSIKLIIHNLLKIFKFIDLRRINFKKVYKFFDIRRYDFYRINKKINPTNYKYVPLYFVALIIFIGFIYVVIPKFYIYDKSKIAKIVCDNQNVECLIKGKIYYSFYPTPRIKIKDLIVIGLFEKKDTLVTVKDVAINLSFKNLLIKKKHKFKKIKFNNFKINLNTKNFKKYKNIFSKKTNLIPITLEKGKLYFLIEKIM